MAVSRVAWRQRWLLFEAALLTLFHGQHHYVATGCLHGDHGYCAGRSGAVGVKAPARCKFCPEGCMCRCHSERGWVLRRPQA